MAKKSVKKTSNNRKSNAKAAIKKAAPKTLGKKLAKIKSTGGFGFNFEDKVAATFLCRMLDGGEVLKVPSAQVVQISWQVAASGWKLDELLLELKDDHGLFRCCISVKSGAYLTNSGFKKDFLAEAWAQ